MLRRLTRYFLDTKKRHISLEIYRILKAVLRGAPLKSYFFFLRAPKNSESIRLHSSSQTPLVTKKAWFRG